MLDLIATVDRPTWQQHAACRGVGPHVFFVSRGQNTAEAKAMCATCPVLAACDAWVAEHPQLHGVWAGRGSQG